MRIFYGRTAVLALLLWLTAGTLSAQSDAQFYLNMLDRGIASAAAGQNPEAARELRIAAFGLLDALPQFVTAQVHLALVYERLGQEADARAAALRVIAAERVASHYATLPLGAELRTRFDALAQRLLAAEQFAVLRGGARPQTQTPAPAPQRQTPVPAPQTQTQTQRQPEPTPPATQPQRQPQTTTPAPSTSEPMTSAPATSRPVPPTPAPQPRAVDVRTRLAEGERLLGRNELTEARAIYRELIAVSSLDHATLLRIAEGAYRARDFETTVRAFGRAGTLRAQEQPYRYYLAVALYETGNYAAAKRELTAALPHIEVTPDVARYKAKIEGSAR
ncbi:MAG TPA: hypothetical protein VF618_06920 [Thermoanaerobaculia bacterium]